MVRMRALPELVQSLPQELFDEIYDLTSTSPPGFREITHTSEDMVKLLNDNSLSYHLLLCSGRPYPNGPSATRIDQGAPNQRRTNQKLLSVSRQSRAQSAASYYGGQDALFAVYNKYLLEDWIECLPIEHVTLLGKIRLYERSTIVYLNAYQIEANSARQLRYDFPHPTEKMKEASGRVAVMQKREASTFGEDSILVFRANLSLVQGWDWGLEASDDRGTVYCQSS